MYMYIQHSVMKTEFSPRSKLDVVGIPTALVSDRFGINCLQYNILYPTKSMTYKLGKETSVPA